MTPKHIILPVDLSENTERQIDYIRTRLRPSEALVTIIHVAEPPLAEDEHWENIEETGPELAKEREDLKGHAKTLREALPNIVVQTKLRVGFAVDFFGEWIKGEEADLIVLGTHRKGPLYDFVFGSVAASIYQVARCPVHVIPAKPLPPYRGDTVIVGIDIWSDGAANCIRNAATIQAVFGASKLLLVHGEVPDFTDVYREWTLLRDTKEERRSFLRKEVQKQVEKAFPSGAPDGIEIHIEFDKPHAVLRRRGTVNNTAALVLGAHRHGPMHDLVLGSVSRKLVKNAEWPVILVPVEVANAAARPPVAFTAKEQFALMQHFPGMDPRYCENLFRHATRIECSEGDTLIRKGEFADRFYLLRSGTVNLLSPIGQQSHVKLQEVGSGDLVGFSWLLPEPVWSLDAVAGRDCELIAFDAPAILRECADNSAFAMQVMQTFCGIIFNRLTAMREAATTDDPTAWSIVTNPGSIKTSPKD